MVGILAAKKRAEENIVTKNSENYDLMVLKLAQELAKLRAYELANSMLKKY